MKMNGQSRTFVKQVKLDLLALSDADLFQIIQHWVEGSNLSGQPLDKAEKIWLALGYTHNLSDTEDLPELNVNMPGSEIEEPVSLIAPEPPTSTNSDNCNGRTTVCSICYNHSISVTSSNISGMV